MVRALLGSPYPHEVQEYLDVWNMSMERSHSRLVRRLLPALSWFLNFRL
jgi:hypothetical protein